MKDFRLVFLAAMLALGSAMPAFADDVKIGFVNTQRIFRDAPAAIKAGKKLDQEFGRRDQDLQRQAKDVQSRQEFLQSKGGTLSADARQQKEKELADLMRDLQRKQQQFREDLDARQNEENAALIERANEAIRTVAKAEHFDVIVQDAVAVSDRIDITEKVIKALAE